MTHPALPAAPGDVPEAHDRLFSIEATPVKFGPGAALDAGVAAGSLACRRHGAVPSLPGATEIAAALAGQPRPG